MGEKSAIESKKYLSNLAKQGLLNLSHMLLGVSICIRGPTLMDMQEIYKTSIDNISFGLTASTFAGLLGTISIGYIWSKYHAYKHLHMFGILVMASITTAILPHAGSLWAFFIDYIVLGMFVAAFHTVCAVLCTEIWSGISDSSPYMHSLQFSFSIGAVLGPVLSMPFLSQRVYEEAGLNVTLEEDVVDLDGTSITLLFPLSALSIFMVSFGYLYLGIRDLSKRKRSLEIQTRPTKKIEETRANSNTKKLLIFVMVIMSSLYAFLEGIIGYIPAFAVKSNYGLTKAEGVHMLTLLVVLYACARVSGIFLAMKFSPTKLFLINGVFLMTGNVFLLIAGCDQLILTQIGFAFIGFGIGPVCANTWMWMEQHVEMTSRVASCLMVGATLGVSAAPMVVGQLIDAYPMMLVYLLAGSTAMMMAVFGVGYRVGMVVKKEEEINVVKSENELCLKIVEKM